MLGYVYICKAVPDGERREQRKKGKEKGKKRSVLSYFARCLQQVDSTAQ